MSENFIERLLAFMADAGINDNQMTVAAGLSVGAIGKIMGSDASVIGPLTMGGEDFARCMRVVPGTMVLLGIRNEEKGCVHAQHSDHYCIDEDVLLNGAMIYAQTAVDFNSK